MSFLARVLKIIESMRFVHCLSAYKANIINRIAENDHYEFLANIGYENVSLTSQKKLIYDSFKENKKTLLIILDGCRLDYFLKHINAFQEFKLNNLLPVISHGSCTLEWLRNTFQQPLKNILYISGNGFVWKKRNSFAKVIKLWDFAWDDNHGTVLAGAVNEAIKVVFEQGVTKVIAHYNQPHAPFVKGFKLNVAHDDLYENGAYQGYILASKNSKVRKEFVRSYNENVYYVMSEVDKLIRYFNDLKENLTIIITSDHGECLGRFGFIDYIGFRELAGLPWMLGLYKIVDHPCNRKYPELVCVPWMEIKIPS